MSSSSQAHSLDPHVVPPFPMCTSSPESHSLPPILPLPSQPTHPMQTRSKSGIVKPRRFPTLLITVTEPSTIKQALSSPPWHEAMQCEYDALMANQTWSLTALPSGRTVIGCKWVFHIKENPNGSIQKYKACLVAKGFHQRLGCDYSETFSLVVKPVTVRLILTLALTNCWSVQQIDINNTFLNGILQ